MDEIIRPIAPRVETGVEHLRDEALLRSVREHGANFFPGFPTLDTSEFDGYIPEEDQYNRGRIVYLTSEVGRGEGKPEIRMIFRLDGFTFGASNTPEPDAHYTVRNVCDSFYGPNGRKWREDEIDLAMIYGRIRMEGVNTESDEFRHQLISWSEKEERFMTMQEELDSYSQYLVEVKVLKKAKQPIEPFQWISPDKVRDLMVARISGGKDALSKGMAERFESDGEFSNSVLRAETTKINAQISLLADRRKLPPIATIETDCLKV